MTVPLKGPESWMNQQTPARACGNPKNLCSEPVGLTHERVSAKGTGLCWSPDPARQLVERRAIAVQATLQIRSTSGAGWMLRSANPKGHRSAAIGGGLIHLPRMIFSRRERNSNRVKFRGGPHLEICNALRRSASSPTERRHRRQRHHHGWRDSSLMAWRCSSWSGTRATSRVCGTLATAQRSLHLKIRLPLTKLPR